MRAGTLRHRISFNVKNESEENRTSYGGYNPVFDLFIGRWAEISPLRGDELEDGSQNLPRATHRIRCRFARDITPDMIVIFGSRIFEIVSVLKTDERKIMMEFKCIEVPGFSLVSNNEFENTILARNICLLDQSTVKHISDEDGSFLLDEVSGLPYEEEDPLELMPCRVNYAHSPGEMNPIGGGTGYGYNLISSSDAVYSPTTVAELKTALSLAAPGEVIWLDPSLTFDLSNDSITIKNGVTLASNRGVFGSQGALIVNAVKRTVPEVGLTVLSNGFTDNGDGRTRVHGASGSTGDSVWFVGAEGLYVGPYVIEKIDSSNFVLPVPLAIVSGTGVGITYVYNASHTIWIGGHNNRITGLRIQGPASEAPNDNVHLGISVGDGFVEIDNCEIFHHGKWAILVRDNHNHRIHHNFFYHTMMDGFGYGVWFQGTVPEAVAPNEADVSLIESNLFYGHRHHIASGGQNSSSFWSRYNYFYKHVYNSSHAHDRHTDGHDTICENSLFEGSEMSIEASWHTPGLGRNIFDNNIFDKTQTFPIDGSLGGLKFDSVPSPDIQFSYSGNRGSGGGGWRDHSQPTCSVVISESIISSALLPTDVTITVTGTDPNNFPINSFLLLSDAGRTMQWSDTGIFTVSITTAGIHTFRGVARNAIGLMSAPRTVFVEAQLSTLTSGLRYRLAAWWPFDEDISNPKLGSILSFASGAATTVTTDGPHGMVNGDSVAIFNTTNYDGKIASISAVTSDTFDIDKPFVGDDGTGFFRQFKDRVDSHYGLVLRDAQFSAAVNPSVAGIKGNALHSLIGGGLGFRNHLELPLHDPDTGVNGDSLLLYDDPLTISCWVYKLSNSSFAGIASQAIGSQGWSIGLSDSGRTFMGVHVFNFINTNVLVPNNAWTHLVFLMDITGNRMRIFINGVLVYDVTTPTLARNFDYANTGLPFQVARSVNNYFDGYIDDLAFWKRLITDPEILQLYNGGLGFTYTDL